MGILSRPVDEANEEWGTRCYCSQCMDHDIAANENMRKKAAERAEIDRRQRERIRHYQLISDGRIYCDGCEFCEATEPSEADIPAPASVNKKLVAK